MLPDAEHAIVSKAKICEYLLCSVDQVGRFNARVLLSLGYMIEAWVALRGDLLHHGRTGRVLHVEHNAYGVKIVISATLKGSNGLCRAFHEAWLIAILSRESRLIAVFLK